MKSSIIDYVLSRGLPKTAQTISYTVGDDGHYENGWDMGQRFVEKTIGGDDVVIDLSTGLMWAADSLEAGCNSGVAVTWATAVTQQPVSFLSLLNQAGFADCNDWYLPNINEMLSIMDYSVVSPSLNPVFKNDRNGYCWTSTTKVSNSLQGWAVYTAIGRTENLLKTELHYVRACRKYK